METDLQTQLAVNRSAFVTGIAACRSKLHLFLEPTEANIAVLERAAQLQAEVVKLLTGPKPVRWEELPVGSKFKFWTDDEQWQHCKIKVNSDSFTYPGSHGGFEQTNMDLLVVPEENL